MRNRSGFTMLEVLVVMIMLSAVIALMVGILGAGSGNRQAESASMKLLNDFSNIEMAFNNFKHEKNAVPVGLTDSTFVPVYLFPPKADSGFERPTTAGWVDGYLLGASANGNYVCAQAAYSDAIAAAASELKKKTSSMKVITNASCGSTTDSMPTSGTVSFTYWISRVS
ncbi:type II secretion system protein [Trichlorobacter lovleyi]|nr:type II secretion system protein [Trichlorobacter lovleyi]